MNWQTSLLHRDARILKRLDAISSLLSQLQRQLTHRDAGAGTVVPTLVALDKIQSKVTKLIGDEFYGLDDQ